MIDNRSQRFVRWVLGVSGVLGLVCAGIMLLMTLGDYGKSSAAANFSGRLPSWIQLIGAPPAGIAMLIVGFLCALLLAFGVWPVKICAALAIAWFIYAEVVFRPGGPLSERIQQTFDIAPFYDAALVSTGVLIAVSVLALIAASLRSSPVVALGEASLRASS